MPGRKPLKDETGDNTVIFDSWFTRYFFPLMTDPKELGNIAEMRQEFFKKYYSTIKNDVQGQQVRDRLNGLTLNFMKNLAIVTPRGEFHPAVRYNAMLIIGDLDSRGAETQGGGSPADPWNDALVVLKDELVSDKQIDAVRVAALIGINRHAEFNRYRPAGRRIPDASIAVLIKPILDIANAKEPPAGRTPAGHNWMRRQAVEILSHFGAVRPIGEVATAINNIVADPDEPLSLRCAAAQAQGRLLNPVADGTTAEAQSQQLARLATECLIADLTDLRSFTNDLESRQPAGEGDGRGGRSFGGGERVDIFGGGDPAASGADEPAAANVAPQITATQRRLKYQMGCVSAGLFGGNGGPGVAAGVKDATVKVQTQRMKEILDGVIGIAEAPPTGDPPQVDAVKGYFSSLAAQGKAIRDLIPPDAPAKEAPDAPSGGPDAGPSGPQPVGAGPAPQRRRMDVPVRSRL